MLSLRRSLQHRFQSLIFSRSFRNWKLTKSAIRRLLRNPVAVIVEVGAADGIDTLEFLSEFDHPQFRIFAIEPDPRNIEKFVINVSDTRARLLPVAVGDGNGVSDFHQSSTPYSSSLKKPNVKLLQYHWPEMKFDRVIKVNVATLDSIVDDQRLEGVDFIWCDIQGAEDLLIAGAKKTLRITRYFYTEYSQENFYEDDNSLDKICQLLGPDWRLLRDYGTDALFENWSLKNACN